MDREVLADFLQQVRHAKQLEASLIRRQMAGLDTDIKTVTSCFQQQPPLSSSNLTPPPLLPHAGCPHLPPSPQITQTPARLA